MPQQFRYALLAWETLSVLSEAESSLLPREVTGLIYDRFQPTPYESESVRSGVSRWQTVLGFISGDAVSVGWMSKAGGWSISDAGREALETYPSPDQLYEELQRRWREIDDRRKQALAALSDEHQFIAAILELVDAGNWTAHEDLAELADTSPDEVKYFLANASVKIPSSYRVLDSDGRFPAERFLHNSYRGTNLRRRLEREGIEFDSEGNAGQGQRLTAQQLKDLWDARQDSEEEMTTTARRAWMVRGTNVDGYNLVPGWLRNGYVSLSASQLGGLPSLRSYGDLKQAVETAYQHKSYAYRGQRFEELDRFMRRMRAGDLVLTPLQGKVHLGELTSDPYFTDSDGAIAGLRRDVTWYEFRAPTDVSELAAPVPALLQSQAYVVDLTEAYDQLAALVPRQPVALRPEPREIEKAQRSLGFKPVTEDLAQQLNMDAGELAKIADLLWERRQLIFYGPPGTGKTFLARALAWHLTEDGAVRLVQFHPSYTYEDFFEGFRPKPADEGTGALSFALTPGPFRLFAEAAKANPTTAYILVIDEINRANLAKVFGELYFLLEYRDEAIALQYSPGDQFTLPQNLFIIGTMNTADRSIARIDSAMRRRFAFVELDPRVPPVQGLLGRWLADKELPADSALLLDLLNARLADADAAIGPSYLMRRAIYERADGLERVWQYEIMPLLEDLFYGQADLAAQYGLPSLRAALGPPGPS